MKQQPVGKAFFGRLLNFLTHHKREPQWFVSAPCVAALRRFSF